jgi:hypothetical protein
LRAENEVGEILYNQSKPHRRDERHEHWLLSEGPDRDSFNQPADHKSGGDADEECHDYIGAQRSQHYHRDKSGDRIGRTLPEVDDIEHAKYERHADCTERVSATDGQTIYENLRRKVHLRSTISRQKRAK